MLSLRHGCMWCKCSSTFSNQFEHNCQCGHWFHLCCCHSNYLPFVRSSNSLAWMLLQVWQLLNLNYCMLIEFPSPDIPILRPPLQNVKITNGNCVIENNIFQLDILFAIASKIPFYGNEWVCLWFSIGRFEFEFRVFCEFECEEIEFLVNRCAIAWILSRF